MLVIIYSLLLLSLGRCADYNEVKSIGVGADVRLKCIRKSTGSMFWIRLVSGKVPEVLARSFSDVSVDPRITPRIEKGSFDLQINTAKISDTGVYFCLIFGKELTFLQRTELRVEESKHDSITTVSPSAPVSPEDSGSLPCSVLCDSENATSPGQPSVCCFGLTCSSTHRNCVEEYTKDPEGLSARKCTDSFFKNIPLAGICDCTGTCGKRHDGNISEPNTEANTCDCQKERTLLYLLGAALAFSLIMIALLLYLIRKLQKKSCGYCRATVVIQETALRDSGDGHSEQTDKESLVYSAVSFTPKKSCKAEGSASNTEVEQSIYTNVRTLGCSS